MDAERIRCIVVDDSALMRATIRKMLEREPGIEVVDTAGSGPVALNKIRDLEPDVVTLDVEMPGMDGIEVLRRLMADTPVPVVMLSSYTQDGAQRTLDALEAGAVDYVGKPTGGAGQRLQDVADILIAKIKAAATANLDLLRERSSHRHAPRASGVPKAPVAPAPAALETVLVVGISAGGPATLVDVFSQLPADVPPILIAQHMPSGFTKSFADRLDRLSAPHVKEAEHGDRILPGHVLIAPGHAHMIVSSLGKVLKVSLDEGPPACGHRPSVDRLFRSTAQICKDRCVGVIMTGMGDDGAEALGTIRAAGGRTFAQSRESCVVFGMPNQAITLGHADQILNLDEIVAVFSGNIPVPA